MAHNLPKGRSPRNYRIQNHPGGPKSRLASSSRGQGQFAGVAPRMDRGAEHLSGRARAALDRQGRKRGGNQ